MKQIPDYGDLEIRIFKQKDQRYPVEITRNSQANYPPGYLTAPIPPEILALNALFSPLSDELFKLLVADPQINSAWIESFGKNRAQRIRLRIDEDSPELHAIPWELMHNNAANSAPGIISEAANTPFSRFIAMPQEYGKAVYDRPIHILLMRANPSNLGDYGLDPLEEQYESDLKTILESSGDVKVKTLVPPCTLDRLRDELKKGYHILHILAHGDKSGNGESFLYFEDETEKVETVDADRLCTMLENLQNDGQNKNGRDLRLIFLSSCQSGAIDTGSQAQNNGAGDTKKAKREGIRSLAIKLVKRGLPAVLAMQESMPIDSANVFATVFYQQLLSHGYVDLACNEARASLQARDDIARFVPVLYMRLAKGLLFGRRGRIFSNRPTAALFGDLGSAITEQGDIGFLVPFIGPRIDANLLPSPEELASEMAMQENYPFGDSDNLPRVAQYSAPFDEDRPRKWIREYIKESLSAKIRKAGFEHETDAKLQSLIKESIQKDIGQRLYEANVFKQLADLNLPLYVTSNYDNFIEEALLATGKVDAVHSINLGWNTDGTVDLSEFPPSRKVPVVLHLFGKADLLNSMVVTEDDYLAYLAWISRNPNIPYLTALDGFTKKNPLLFLGFRFQDLALKVILRGVLSPERINLKAIRPHLAVQFDPSEQQENQEQNVLEFLKKYFQNQTPLINYYEGTSQQFIAELHDRQKGVYDYASTQ